MEGRIVVVKAAWDEEAGIWFVESSDLPGLNVEAASIEEMVKKLPGAVADLLELGEGDAGAQRSYDVPIELIAHASTRVRIGDSA